MTNDNIDSPTADANKADQHAAAEAEPFRLAGSLKILVSDEELEAGIAEERRRQAELFEAKLRSWLE
jgi:hypothetical protein